MLRTRIAQNVAKISRIEWKKADLFCTRLNSNQNEPTKAAPEFPKAQISFFNQKYLIKFIRIVYFMTAYYCDKYQFPTSIIVFIAYNLQWFKLNKIRYALLTGTHFYISIFLAHNICLYSGNSNDLCILLILLVRETR